MLIGELEVQGTTETLSPEIAARAENGVFIVEALEISGSFPVVGVTIEHKNMSETAWATAATFAAITVPTLKSKVVSGLKEVLRFKLTFSTGGAGARSRIYIYDPLWRE